MSNVKLRPHFSHAPAGRGVHARGLLERAGHERPERLRRERQRRRAQVALHLAQVPRPAPRVGLGLDGGADKLEGGRLNAP